jgi:hypothetical protein
MKNSTVLKKSTATPARTKSATRERLTDTASSKTVREAGDAYGDLLKVFREVISLEREVEFAKQDLALRNDFNPFDAFRYFDKKGKTFISVAELEEGFGEIGIFPAKPDLYLFIRRFDKQGDGKLRFGDFVDAFTPVQAEYYRLLKSRTPINGDLALEAREVKN